jgi:hypothetical protein
VRDVITRLQVLKLIQIGLALPAYTVPASATIGFILWYGLGLLTGLLTSQMLAGAEWGLLLLVASLYSQWACWSIFADGLEDIPAVAHLPWVVFGLVLTLLLGIAAWVIFRTGLFGFLCGSQGIVACVLLVINLLRRRAADSGHLRV